MRRLLAIVIIAVGALLVVGQTAGAYPGDPNDPNAGHPGVLVGGISVTRQAVGSTGASSTSPSNGQLAVTGSQGATDLVWVGAGLVIVGGALVVASRRYRRLLKS